MKAQHVLIILAFLLFGSCVARKKEAEVRYENGIKHIVNPISPAGHTTGERRLDLIREFSIDFENTGSSRPSFTEVIGFDVDAAGNTFVLTTRSGDEFVHIFGSRGEYRASFGRQGQGPGELQDPKYIEVHASTVTILDFGKKKLLEYGTDGVYARESPVPSNVRRTASLNGGHRIVLRGRPDQESGLIRFPVLLCDASFNDLKALSPGKSMPIFALAKKINGLDLGIDYEAWQIFDKSIYVGDPGGGYDIKIYDFEGRPKLVISKKYNPVPVSEEYKQHINDWLGKNARESLGKLLFPSFFPAYRYFFLDEGGRLFVMTYEQAGDGQGFLYDIFDADGFLMGRTRFDNVGILPSSPLRVPVPLKVVAKAGRIYYLREKQTGYKELVVCRPKWR